MTWFGPSSPVGVLLGAYGMVVLVAAASERGAGYGTLLVSLAIAVAVAAAVARVSPVAWVRHVAVGTLCGIAGAVLLNAFLGNWIVAL